MQQLPVRVSSVHRSDERIAIDQYFRHLSAVAALLSDAASAEQKLRDSSPAALSAQLGVTIEAV